MYIKNIAHTLIRGSAKLVHIEISSLTLMSGYLFRVNSASNSCNCCEVKCVLCRRPLLLFSPESFVQLLLPLFTLEPFATIEGSVN